MGPGASGPWHCPLFMIICHGGLTETKLRTRRHCQASSRVSEGIGRGARGQDALSEPLQGVHMGAVQSHPHHPMGVGAPALHPPYRGEGDLPGGFRWQSRALRRCVQHHGLRPPHR